MDVCCSLVASDCDHLCFGAFFRLRKVVNLLVSQVVADCDCVTSHLVGFDAKHGCVAEHLIARSSWVAAVVNESSRLRNEFFKRPVALLQAT